MGIIGFQTKTDEVAILDTSTLDLTLDLALNLEKLNKSFPPQKSGCFEKFPSGKKR